MTSHQPQTDHEISEHLIEDDGRFPNKPNVPLVVARQVLTAACSAQAFEELFGRNERMAGDAIIIPAGVAHRCISANRFVCVGAYPRGQSWDTCMGQPNVSPMSGLGQMIASRRLEVGRATLC